MAGAIGIIFGMPSVRVKGFYLAITTIAAQFIILYVLRHWSYAGIVRFDCSLPFNRRVRFQFPGQAVLFG
jgi:ABC-type branched-subunit amino acid transport system permease subunit